MALTQNWIQDQIWSPNRENRREGEKRRGEEEEEKEKRRRREAKIKKVWNFGFLYETTKFEYGSLVCMIIILPKPRVLLGFHHNTKIMEIKVGKTLNSTIRI